MIPALAKVYLPALVGAMGMLWPTAPTPQFSAGQVEQETCPSLSSHRCWNPKTELKTSREYGFGLGQITRAYTSSGEIRFDTFSELVKKHAELKNWTWANRYDAGYQLKALVLMDRDLYRRVKDAATPADQLAFALSAYNGGMGGVLQDRLLCRNTAGCDSTRWFGNVAEHSLKSRKKWHGYGLSAFDINRQYVSNILKKRMQKYAPFFHQAAAKKQAGACVTLGRFAANISQLRYLDANINKVKAFTERQNAAAPARLQSLLSYIIDLVWAHHASDADTGRFIMYQCLLGNLRFGETV